MSAAAATVPARPASSSCRRHDVDPQIYLTQLLINLSSLRMSDLLDGLPTDGRPHRM